RYRYKDSLKPTWERKTNWNRWAVHGNSKRNNFESDYAWYNQTLGLGFYEYFLLCEAIGAKALPVLNVGFACQYMSTEMVSIESEEFKNFVKDALDLIEFANGDVNSEWGSVRAKMGHKEPFNLELLGIGNEQWQTERADFFERYEAFERAIHAKYPGIKLIGSAGPDITSEKYTAAWNFYRKNKDKENFVYAIDEHYYVKPEWLFEHNEFYDDYDRKIKVFSGEYAAHPKSGFNMPDSNTLWGALSEAAFLTGVERNADVVVLASYAPLFARVNYAQWAPDMIWFDPENAYGTPSYYVQKLFSSNMGDKTLSVDNLKELRADGIYVSASFDETVSDTILKVVNSKEERVSLELPENVSAYKLSVLTGDCKDACNLITDRERVGVTDKEVKGNRLELPALSFAVLRF
ncbi:MAG: alpha-L-arabinofuranosidase, partial [Lachnospiraceae bacterium]|nr:alpha-L-arabinofuranosidase [Lachnospiraceae bacterium]